MSNFRCKDWIFIGNYTYFQLKFCGVLSCVWSWIILCVLFRGFDSFGGNVGLLNFFSMCLTLAVIEQRRIFCSL